MSDRNLYLLGAAIGGTAGGLLPGLWGASDFSGSAVLLSIIGSVIGLVVIHRYVKL